MNKLLLKTDADTVGIEVSNSTIIYCKEDLLLSDESIVFNNFPIGRFYFNDTEQVWYFAVEAIKQTVDIQVAGDSANTIRCYSFGEKILLNRSIHFYYSSLKFTLIVER